MANLVVVLYDDQFRAKEVMKELKTLKENKQLEIDDAAYVTKDNEGQLPRSSGAFADQERRGGGRHGRHRGWPVVHHSHRRSGRGRGGGRRLPARSRISASTTR